ncbi:hypothetical protein DTO166G4_3265 [Paecilomyces variotii]|uniref:Cell wall protein n=1 Tax=Byssochlamys spectabilis TaxID=264951 RepID=A0A443HLD5_BYSSP|nr:hypothetical protein C8Q69DRAFT_84028 [Paecilomyces variotii]KAJ9215187.1 hypothetical protein DTO166G4_3265 [Paecilomyces variotii]KAJ9237652.1 hypothetical protein DTO166G5_3416 [Paecilomyces variotii]KAJ9258099.1 hypothetical protein DTO195F2_5324 [Paecilomyces variotii]KAJ9359042.1 hypothetical protein DTO280E4_4905 [Paecilomyces variotii]KAJ9372800.1 hypothetical protein DTO282E5_2527 [Paecilomyces variotii]
MAYLRLYQLLIGLVAVTATQAAPSIYGWDALVPRGVPDPVRKLTFVPSHRKDRRQTVGAGADEVIEASTSVSESETDVVSVDQTDAELEKKIVQIQAGNQAIITEQDELRVQKLVTVQKTTVVQVVQQVVDIRAGVAVTSYAVREITKVAEQQEEVTQVFQVADANIITVGAGSCDNGASAAILGTSAAASSIAAIATTPSAPVAAVTTAAAAAPVVTTTTPPAAAVTTAAAAPPAVTTVAPPAAAVTTAPPAAAPPAAAPPAAAPPAAAPPAAPPAAPAAAAVAARAAPFQMNNQTMMLMPAPPPMKANMQAVPDPGAQVTGGIWSCGV